MNATEVTEVQDRGPAAYIAEFVGTLLLVFFITAVVSLYVSTDPARFVDFSVIGLVHAFLLFGLIQTLGLISGAHSNPAVTVVMTVLRQIKPPDAAIRTSPTMPWVMVSVMPHQPMILMPNTANGGGSFTAVPQSRNL